MAIWRIPSLHLSRTQARYPVGSMRYNVVQKQVYGMLRKLASPESGAFTAYTGDDTPIHGAACYLPDRIGHLYKCRPPPPLDIIEPTAALVAYRSGWYIDARGLICPLHAGGTTSPNQISSWWLLRGSENRRPCTRPPKK